MAVAGQWFKRVYSPREVSSSYSSKVQQQKQQSIEPDQLIVPTADPSRTLLFLHDEVSLLPRNAVHLKRVLSMVDVLIRRFDDSMIRWSVEAGGVQRVPYRVQSGRVEPVHGRFVFWGWFWKRVCVDAGRVAFQYRPVGSSVSGFMMSVSWSVCVYENVAVVC